MRIALLLVLAAACSKDKAPAAPAPRALPWLHLTIDVPADATLEAKASEDYAALEWADVHLAITANGNPAFHRTLADALAAAGGKVSKSGTTADGWEARYDQELAGDTVHFVVIHRQIAEREWECTGGGAAADAADAVARACATLRP